MVPISVQLRNQVFHTERKLITNENYVYEDREGSHKHMKVYKHMLYGSYL